MFYNGHQEGFRENSVVCCPGFFETEMSDLPTKHTSFREAKLFQIKKKGLCFVWLEAERQRVWTSEMNTAERR